MGVISYILCWSYLYSYICT